MLIIQIYKKKTAKGHDQIFTKQTYNAASIKDVEYFFGLS